MILRLEQITAPVCAALILSACGGGGGGDSTPAGPVDIYASVDPFIGTGGVGFGVGSAYPGAALPFAMIHAGPDTRAPYGAPGPQHCAGYWWEDPQIEGFSLTRMNGTGVPDYGTIGLMPVDGMTDAKRDEPGYAAAFSHDDEEAEPGYYRVELADGIRVEITTASRAAIFRFTFPAGADPVVLMDLEHTLGEGDSTGGEVTIDAATGGFNVMMHNNGELSGRFGGFDIFAAGAVTPLPSEIGTWDDSGLADGKASAAGIDTGGWLRFAPGTTEVVLRVGISFVDGDGAAGNLAAEMPGFDFDAVRTAARDTWIEELARFEIEGATERDATLVATSLYKSLLMPTLISDVDGRAISVDGEAVDSDRPRYSDFSLWDTYRTLHPWLLLSEDSRNADFVQSLMKIAEEGGAFPRWQLAHGDIHSMIGSPGEIVMAESSAKGVVFDEGKAFDYALATSNAPATGPTGGRGSAADYVAYGFVPDDLAGGSVSKTLEYASADAALAAWARRLGRDADANILDMRADSWRAILEPTTGFMRPKNSDGSWAAWDDPLREYDAYVEGNAWQYSWMVPHDLNGLGEAMGGRDAILTKLRGLFDSSAAEGPTIGPRLYYWHGNEPDLIAAWIFAALGEPGETAKWVDWILTERYGLGADGLPGNDDGATMSSWVLFAAAGIYPIAGTDRYIVGAPRQSVMVIHRPGGDLRIKADPHPRDNPVPIAVTLDGEPVTTVELTHDQLAGAHTLEFTMAPADD